MRAAGVALVVIAVELSAIAQPAPCDPCTRGDQIIEQYSLQPIRTVASDIVKLPVGDKLSPAQYARIVDLRKRVPALVRLGAVEDKDFAAVAATLCQAPTGSCVDATTHTLQCIADRCAVELSAPDLRRGDPKCKRGDSLAPWPPYGLGIEWGSGVQRSSHPVDGRAWSLGIETRLRLANRIGLVARLDRIAGRDETTDIDGNGSDDLDTGGITRLAMLGGPSFVIAHQPFDEYTHFLRLDLLGGYLSTRSQPDESGFAAGVDLTYEFSIVRMGARFVQGFGDARDATTVIAHLGFISGAKPNLGADNDCDSEAPAWSRLAIGFDIPIAGYGFADLGYVGTGIGFEALWYVTRSVDLVTRADLLLYPNPDGDRTIHQAVLGGIRIDHGSHKRSWTGGFFTTLMGGYTHSGGFTPTTSGSGPIVDASLAWGGQSTEGAAYVRVHARFGLDSDNRDYRAVFLSGGFEVRWDPSRWRARIQ